MAATSNKSETIEILENLLRILKDEKVFEVSNHETIIRFRHPEELQKIIAPQLKEDASTKEEIEEAIKLISRYSVKTFSPHFHNQLFSGVDDYGLAGTWLAEVFNTSQYTFEVAPVFTLLEKEILERTLELVGYPAMPFGDGILGPGGSMSNMYGMVLARYSVVPEVKSKGLYGFPPLACFTSQGSHYSIMKGAHWLGLGTDNVYKVKTDEFDRMIPEELKKEVTRARNKGQLPFFVNATSGTTVLGAFDPLDKIAAVCREEKLWLHVDACLGGTLLFSEKYRDRMKGIEQSNSIAWNPHKLLGAPLQCSLFLVKGKNALHEANCAGAKYLFQQDKFYDVSWDTGDKSVQCGRKVDAMKFWLMWKARGTRGLRESVDLAVSVADYFLRKIQNRPGFRLVVPKFECTNICFWYIPPSMRGQKETEDWWKKLYTVAPKVKERMVLNGTIMIGYTPLLYKNYGNFFRLVVTCQPKPQESSMDFAIEQIEKFGQDL